LFSTSQWQIATFSKIKAANKHLFKRLYFAAPLYSPKLWVLMDDSVSKNIDLLVEPAVFNLMISHAGVDQPLAAAWKKMLKRLFPGAHVWYSSDHSAFPPGQESNFAVKIENEIRSADFLLTIQTPNSRFRPWLIWEAGIARGVGKENIGILVVVYGLKPGKTDNPLDAHHQYSQDADDNDPNNWESCIKNVKDIIGIIQPKGIEYHPGELTDAIKDYISAVKEHGPLLECDIVNYDKRIHIKLSKLQLVTLKDKNELLEGVRVEGLGNSLSIFGFAEDENETTWGGLMRMLKDRSDKWPYPGTAVRWAEALGRFLASAVNRNINLNVEAEALPLYLNYIRLRPSSSISYRPAVTRKIIEAGDISFEVVFVELPPELVAYPEGVPAPLYHYISFCRMVRWGLLQSEHFSDLFGSGELGEEAKKMVNDFATKLMNIRVEFLN
jgi:hypothetical protein